MLPIEKKKKIINSLYFSIFLLLFIYTCIELIQTINGKEFRYDRIIIFILFISWMPTILKRMFNKDEKWEKNWNKILETQFRKYFLILSLFLLGTIAAIIFFYYKN